MPPKAGKKEAPVERPILGRFSSHLKIGIVSSFLLIILLLYYTFLTAFIHFLLLSI